MLLAGIDTGRFPEDPVNEASTIAAKPANGLAPDETE